MCFEEIFVKLKFVLLKTIKCINIIIMFNLHNKYDFRKFVIENLLRHFSFNFVLC